MSHKRLYGIDLMKFLCATLVVGIHTEPFAFSTMLDNGFGILTRIAVPFFFIASAYLFFLKPLTTKHLGQFLKRIFILYLIWFAIYVLFDCLYLANPITLSTFFDFLVYGFKHFWYLQATIVSICLCVLLLRIFRNKVWGVYVAVCLLYVWGTLNSTYSMLLPFEDPIISVIGSRNGIYYAPIFVMMGYALSQQHKTISVKKNRIIVAVMFCILAIESAIGVLLLKSEATILWFSTPALMYAIFSVVLGCQIRMSDGVATLLRKLSIGIYCVHPIWITILQPEIGYGIPLFFTVFLLSASTSLLIYYASNKIGILKYFL